MKRKNNTLNICKYILLISLLGCGSVDTIESEDVNEDKIYQRYSVSYYAGNKKLYYGAQYRVGGSTGTTVELSTPSNVVVNDDQLNFRNGDSAFININGSSYYLYKDGLDADETEFVFQWTMSDGTVKTNKINLGAHLEVTSLEEDEEIDIAKDLTLEFSGGEKDGGVECSITSLEKIPEEKKEVLVSTLSRSSVTTSSCIFSASNLAKLPIGDAKVSVHRSIVKSLDESTDESGVIYGGYTSEYISVKIVQEN